MGMGDKIKAQKDKAVGKAKQKEGEATNDPNRAAQGKSDQRKADLKRAGEDVKGAFKEK